MSSITPQMNSLTSGLMLGVTLYRNQPGIGNKCVAQVGYALTTTVAAAESAAALTFSAASLALYPLSSAPLDNSVNWLSSSSFSIVWSATDFLLNPFVIKLVADEPSARQIASSGNLMRIPRGAII
ncbi:MAG: hypothetical protein H7A37_00560 [Chlamydiales bacterium]|nr:hypothetical protein [Chlamydiales bacterium]